MVKSRNMKVWYWMTGKEKYDIPIQEAVEPFIVVKGKKRRWLGETDMGGERSTACVRRKGRKGKVRGKRKKRPNNISKCKTRVWKRLEMTVLQRQRSSRRRSSEQYQTGGRRARSGYSQNRLFRGVVGETRRFQRRRVCTLPFSSSRVPLMPCLKLHISVYLRFPFTR